MTRVRDVLAVALRDLRATYATVVGWAVAFAWLTLCGEFFYFSVFAYAEASQEQIHDPYLAGQLRMSTWLFAPFLSNCAIVLLMLSPLISMRVFSEDLRNKTMDLLLTSPISTLDIVLGKYAGLVANLVLMIGATAVFPLLLTPMADPDVGSLAAGYLGLLLLGSSIVAVGMWVSSFTANQAVAAAISFGAMLALFVLSFVSDDPDSVVSQIAILPHLQDLLRGEVRLSDVVYYLALDAFFVFATWQRVEAYRWS